MKLIVAILQSEKNKKLYERLLADGFRFTAMPSRGGFLGKAGHVLLLGAEEAQVDAVLAIFKACCKTKSTTLGSSSEGLSINALGDFATLSKTATIQVGGATIFVLDVEKFIRF